MKKVLAVFICTIIAFSFAGCSLLPLRPASVELDQFETVDLLSFWAPSAWYRQTISDGLRFSPRDDNNYFSVRCMDALSSFGNDIFDSDIMDTAQMNAFLKTYELNADVVTTNEINDYYILGLEGKSLHFIGTMPDEGSIEVFAYTFIYGGKLYIITFSSPRSLSRELTMCMPLLLDSLALTEIVPDIIVPDYSSWDAYFDSVYGKYNYYMVREDELNAIGITPFTTMEPDQFFDLGYTVFEAFQQSSENGLDSINGIAIVTDDYQLLLAKNANYLSGYVSSLNFEGAEDPDVRAAYNVYFARFNVNL